MLKQETKMIQEKLGEYCRSGEYAKEKNYAGKYNKPYLSDLLYLL